MRKFLNEYLNVVLYTISIILIILSTYTIIININHAIFLNKKVVVSDIDNDFQKFRDNVIKIEDKIENRNDSTFIIIFNLLKNDGLYKLMPGDNLDYADIYNLNNYFIDKIINEGYISSLKQKNNIKIYDEFINNLIYKANYINRELENNSNYQYDVLNNEIRDSINDEYQMIINNYQELSYIILEMCDVLWKK